jgi:hypothetical protein
MARSFYAESKRVRNDRIKRELGVRLSYPDYRSGLAQLLSAETEELTLPPAGKLLYSGARPRFKGSTGHETLPHDHPVLRGAAGRGVFEIRRVHRAGGHPRRGEQIDPHHDALAS